MTALPVGAPSPEPLDTTTSIETPEHVRFGLRVAGPARRALAYGIDLVVRVLLVALVIACLVLAGFSSQFEELGTGVVFVGVFVLDWGYFVLSETLMHGQSVGKRVLNLRVVKEGGHPATFLDSVLRNLMRGVDLLPTVVIPTYLVGVVVMSFDARFRRLGDLVAGTLVVVEEKHDLATPLKMTPSPTPAEQERLVGVLALEEAERDAIELFLRRARRLSPGRAQELAEMIAPELAKRSGVPYDDPVRFLALLHSRSAQRKVRSAAA
ncbi:MAG: RDD family protein [Nannocystaceae bacterium]|nr:RDD family protein [Nannocystaceae bacterium]